ETNHKNLHIFFTQGLEELRLLIVTRAILTVSYDNQRASSLVVVAAFFVISDVFSRQIHTIDDRRLPAFDVKRVEPIHQSILARREVLDRFNLVAADEPLKKSFVALLVAVDDRLGRIDHLIKLRSQ